PVERQRAVVVAGQSEVAHDVLLLGGAGDDPYAKCIPPFSPVRPARAPLGSVQYKAVDTGYPPSRASNCIHAIGEIVGRARARVASPGWGETASYVLLRRMEPWILDDRKEQPWIEEALGLNDYPIIRRDYERRFPMIRRRFPDAPTGPRE